MYERKSEQGQALVLIILAIVGLFGFAALAVDLGQVFAARRNAQNAADAAAMAAAYDAKAGSKDSATALAKGFELATTNGFDNNVKAKYDSRESDNLVVVNNPPDDKGPYCGVCRTGFNDYYEVRIKVRLHPIFAQIIYQGAQEVTVQAIAHAKDPETLSPGNAIQALYQDPNDTACNGGMTQNAMVFDGNTSVTVKGGTIYSNGCWNKNGGSGKIAVKDFLNPSKYLTDGIQTTKDFFTCSGCNSGTVLPQVKTSAPVVSIADLQQAPNCPTTPGKTTVGDIDYYYFPNGIHNQEINFDRDPYSKQQTNKIVCVDKGTSPSAISQSKITGHNMMLVLLSGDMEEFGNRDKNQIDIRAATSMIEPIAEQWGGMAIYMPKSNAGSIHFGGDHNAYLQGTIFAPAASCEVGGSSTGAYQSSIICNKVSFNGGESINVIFDAAAQFHNKPTVELVQ